MPNLGVPELLIIMVVIVIIFGVGRLPELGGALGRGIKEFKSASREEDSSPHQLASKVDEPAPDAERPEAVAATPSSTNPARH